MGDEIQKLSKTPEKEKISYTYFREKMIKVKVLSHKDEIINATLPVKFVRSIIETIGDMPNIDIDDIKGIKPQQIMDIVIAAMDNDIDGKILDIQSDEGDSIEIIIE